VLAHISRCVGDSADLQKQTGNAIKAPGAAAAIKLACSRRMLTPTEIGAELRPARSLGVPLIRTLDRLCHSLSVRHSTSRNNHFLAFISLDCTFSLTMASSNGNKRAANISLSTNGRLSLIVRLAPFRDGQVPSR
jgi:hypothetical protein